MAVPNSPNACKQVLADIEVRYYSVRPASDVVRWIIGVRYYLKYPSENDGIIIERIWLAHRAIIILD